MRNARARAQGGGRAQEDTDLSGWGGRDCACARERERERARRWGEGERKSERARLAASGAHTADVAEAANHPAALQVPGSAGASCSARACVRGDERVWGSARGGRSAGGWFGGCERADGHARAFAPASTGARVRAMLSCMHARTRVMCVSVLRAFKCELACLLCLRA
eukprot:1882283-Pleurochrysis_carterae.AAC.1